MFLSSVYSINLLLFFFIFSLIFLPFHFSLLISCHRVIASSSCSWWILSLFSFFFLLPISHLPLLSLPFAFSLFCLSISFRYLFLFSRSSLHNFYLFLFFSFLSIFFCLSSTCFTSHLSFSLSFRLAPSFSFYHYSPSLSLFFFPSFFLFTACPRPPPPSVTVWRFPRRPDGTGTCRGHSALTWPSWSPWFIILIVMICGDDGCKGHALGKWAVLFLVTLIHLFSLSLSCIFSFKNIYISLSIFV